MMGVPIVLVVDDYEDTRAAYAMALEHQGFCIVEAEDGQQALEMAFREQPDVIIMDLGLPKVDGWEAIRRLRGDARTRDLPILAVSGYSIVDNPGFDLLLVKPISPDELTRQVRVHLAARAR